MDSKYWDEKYSTEEFIYTKVENRFVVEFCGPLEVSGAKRAIELAGGEGRNSVWLAKQGIKVVGFDASDIALKKAKQFAKDNQVEVEYSFSDTDSFTWHENAYDAVIGIFIQFADPQMRKRIFQQTYMALKPGGFFILQGYTPKQLVYKTGGPSLIEHLYTEEMIRDLAREFQILDLRCYEKELNEGARHAGMSALLGLVAKK
jgi:2-polyprenyl-3-methyl-5-hydroxy-6-metoxy-1,4-benzoquinol methylase